MNNTLYRNELKFDKKAFDDMPFTVFALMDCYVTVVSHLINPSLDVYYT